uniref:Uncharacterized protein LOC102808834 n=1 Tax=Saccoglossus kowalevskii TaxID=10224 RepID=A0ABM0MDH1_SACKO|nr:PREDICTED: uncharacterized protein LOC102808834 [Saccoglossus kowalevskii]
MAKQRSLLNVISLEVSLLDQIMIMTSHLTNLKIKQKLEIFRVIKDECISIVLQVQGKVKYSSKDYKSNRCSGQTWKILRLLQKIMDRDKKWTVDRTMSMKIVDHMIRLNTASSERQETLEAKIHPLKWIFLECLGFFSFFGVLLLQAYSYKMELAMCIITVFSISLLCYVVADLDSPFNGFFKINLSCLHEIIDKSEDMYLCALDNKDPYQIRADEIWQNIIDIHGNEQGDDDDEEEESNS